MGEATPKFAKAPLRAAGATAPGSLAADSHLPGAVASVRVVAKFTWSAR